MKDEREALIAQLWEAIFRGQAHRIEDAIDAAMSFAYAEGRADQAEDDAKLTGSLFEKAARLMNETGQGEHMGVK